MASISKPDNTFALTAVPPPIDNAPQRVLIIGQQETDKSTDAVLIKNISPDGAEDALFGRQTMLATAIRSFREINTITQVDAIPLNDPAGLEAEAVVTITGTALIDTTITFFIQNKKFAFPLDVTKDDTNLVLAASLTAAINADDTVLVTAIDNVDGTLDVKATNVGTENNSLTIEFQQAAVSGYTIGLGGGFAGGTAVPDISTILNQVNNIRYQSIIYPASYDKTVIRDFLDSRFNVTNAVLDGVGFTSEVGTRAALEAIALPIDSLSMVLLGNQEVSTSTVLGSKEGAALFAYNLSIAAYMVALRTLRLTEGANVANIVSGPLTQFGGPQFAAIPYFNTPVEVLSVIEEEEGWTRNQQESLNTNGVSFLGNNTSNTRIILGAMVTTYLTNEQGQSDKTFKFLNTVDTGSNIREFYVNNNNEEFAQSELTSGDIVPGSRLVDIASFNGFQESLYKELSVQPFVLTVAGDDALDFFKNNISTTADFAAGKLSPIMTVPINTQLREIDATLRITFDINTSA